MDYGKHYKLLIQKAQNRVYDGYTEKHHIILRSEGGSDNKSNIVKLTAREHFVAHWLLYRENPTKQRAYAFHLMCNSNLNKHRYTPSSRTIAEAREVRQYYKPSQESIDKMIESKKGFKHTDETKDKIRQTNKGRVINQAWKENMSKSAKGKIRSNETKQKISKALTGKLINNKPILQFDLQGNFIKEWVSVCEAKKHIKVGDIYACCQERAKSAGGYKWKFKK